MTERSPEKALERLTRQLQSLAEGVHAGLPQEAVVVEAAEALSASLEELHGLLEEYDEQQQKLRRALDAVEAERRRYRELFEQAPDAYVVTNGTGVILAANRAAESLLGRPVARLTYRPLSLFAEAGHLSILQHLLEQAHEHGAGGPVTLCLRPDRRPRHDVYVMCGVRLVPHDHDDPALHWILRDISAQVTQEAERERLLDETARQRQEAVRLADQLAHERDLLDTIMEHTDVHLAYLDRDLNFARVNSAYARGSGHTPEELLGRNHFDLFPNEENEAIFRRVRDTGIPAHFRARPFTYADQPDRGVTYWDWSLEPIRDSGGEVSGLVFSLNDVTERERSRLAREAHLASLGRLVSSTQDLLAQATVQDLLDSVARAARELTGAQMALAGYETPDGRFRISLCSAFGPCVAHERALADHRRELLDLVSERESFCLAADELGAHRLTRILPEGHGPLREALGSRLTDRDGRPRGVVLVADPGPGVFGPEDETIVAELAPLASLGLWHILATQEARRRADQMDAVFGAMASAVFVYDADGAIVASNPAAEEILGESPLGRDRGAISQRIQFRLPDGTPVPVEGLPSSRALRGERIVAAAHVVSVPQGDVSLLVSAAPLRQRGEPNGAVVVWQNVTERERLLAELTAERERLRSSEERARALLNAPDDYAALLDPQGRILAINEVAAGFLGQPSEELVGRGLLALLAPELAEPLGRGLDEAVRCGRTAEGEARAAGRLVHLTCIPVREADGRVGSVAFYARDVTEARRAAEELFRREQEFRALVENSPDLVVRVGGDMGVAYANPAVEQLLGAPIEEAAAWYRESPGGLANLGENIEGVFGEGVERTLEVDVDLGEETRSFEARLVPERGSDGSVSTVLVVARDITERQRSRAALRRYATRLQVLRSMDQAILAAQSAEEMARAGLLKLRQIVPFLRASVARLDVPEGMLTVLAAAGEAEGEEGHAPGPRDSLPLGSAWYLDTLRAGGTYRVADLADVEGEGPACEAQEVLRRLGLRGYAAVPLRAEGELLGVLALGMAEPGRPDDETLDIMCEVADELAIGIRQAELHSQIERHSRSLEATVARRTAALRESEERFRAMYERAAMGIALLNEGGAIDDANGALQAILGYDLDGLRGRRLWELEDLGQAPMEAEWQRLLAEEVDHLRGERRYLNAAGHIVWAEQVITAVRRPQGGRPFAIAMLDDITERKRVLAAMVQHEKLSITGRLAASLAHEINNPLQAVIGCLGLTRELLASGGCGEDATRYVDVGLEELRRASRIVTQLRDVHRPSPLVERRAVDVNEVVRQVMDVTHRQAQDLHVTTESHLGAVPLVLAARDRIMQVVLNLVLNALDAMPDGGTLTLTTEASEEPAGLYITVADTGRGIELERLPFVFDLFYTSKAENAGLGLFITQSIVEEHGGHIGVSSAVNEGTSFTVWLPV